MTLRPQLLLLLILTTFAVCHVVAVTKLGALHGGVPPEATMMPAGD